MIRRVRIVIRGAVQGVGFRPFVYRLASELKLPGWVLNSAQGVFIEAEGEKPVLEAFLLRLEKEKPPRSFIQSFEFSFLDPVHLDTFEIRHSSSAGETNTLVLPDIATCPDCLREILDPADRRHRYPFTNCTNCGPRYTIIESLPYDRAATSMSAFEMCPSCRREYEDPTDRRFHAQPNACPDCGPELQLWNAHGETLAVREDALALAAEAIRVGKVAAVKGLGGFHLIVDARSDRAVSLLRTRKHREEKPLALMYPDLEAVRRDCRLSLLEERLLTSPERPIVLLDRLRAPAGRQAALSGAVAPGNPALGVMLPYTPLHHLLLGDLGFPVVATSGNVSDEPISIDEREALARLGGIADLFLVHDRRIVRHVDDSIVRVTMGRELVLRRARGYAPLPCPLGRAAPPVLAVGAHLKNTVSLTIGENAFISQHIGDLETRAASDAFLRVISDFRGLYRTEAETVAADMHPDYVSSRFAAACGKPVVRVQHHYAHVLSCMADNGIEGPVLGVAWDGTGYGPDGSVWGGEFLLTGNDSFERAAHLRTFPLPGGDRAVREPRRAAAGLLYQVFGPSFCEQKLPCLESFSVTEKRVLRSMLARGVNSPPTSSAGRLFDAVASIAGLRQHCAFEGQAAMELEFAYDAGAASAPYPFPLRKPGSGAAPLVVDWEPALLTLIGDVQSGASPGAISAAFHLGLAEAIVEVARRAGRERVVLSGGCFQNRVLTELAVRRLEAEGFRPYWHQRVPPNDGGIALGQAVAALGKTAGSQ